MSRGKDCACKRATPTQEAMEAANEWVSDVADGKFLPEFTAEINAQRKIEREALIVLIDRAIASATAAKDARIMDLEKYKIWWEKASRHNQALEQRLELAEKVLEEWSAEQIAQALKATP